MSFRHLHIKPQPNPLRPAPFTPLSDCTELAHPVLHFIAEQLPQGLRDRLGVWIDMDSYFIGCTATFFTRDGQQFKTRLEPVKISNGRHASARIPDAFLAHLCLVVR